MHSCKILSAGLCSLALMVIVSGDAIHAGKGSNGVVKVGATATKIEAGKQTVTVTLVVDKGWHIYANPVKNEDLDPVKTVVTVNADAKPTAVKIKYPAGKQEKLGEMSFFVYHDKVVIEAVVTRAAGDTSPLEVDVRFNACHDVNGVCLAPGSKKFTLP